ncbi:hypothetical protein MMC22_005128 [Lobaria immixta]|nr:hypothetical protein [Lobaria immixta]
MATPAFGFSVGDFVSAINLVNKVRKSLKDAGGAASEYQSAVIELENLATTLSHLEALQPNEDNIQHVNAIRAMAMACQFPLEEFRRKMTRYESSLGPLARQKSLYTIGQKTKWSVMFAEDVEKLRALIAAKHVSINLLLGMQTSKTLSKMGAEMRSSVQRLEEKIAEHHTILYTVQGRTQSMDDRIKLAQAADHEILKSIHTGVDRMDLSVVQARHFGQQIMDYLNSFSGKIQGLLRAILQSNLQTYQLMLQMQQNISPRPTNLLESNIRFEDALGEIKELPYEYFRHWEPFEGFLRAHFRHKPGESKIVNSQYYIIDSANKEAIIKKDHWTRYIREGSTVSMSMIMSYIKLQSGICPRPGCSGAGSRAKDTSNTLYCKTCSLEFFHLENNLEDSFRCITILPEDEEIAKKQIAEDMSLYGSRLDPPDAVEVDEHNQLSNLPPKRSVAEFDAARITAIDWNSGATPLDAWLNQSAVPSIVPLHQTQRNQSSSSSDNLAAKELEDLKVFRTIHIEGIEEPKSVGIPRNSAIDLTTLEPSTQIYLRNILDRYPLLPSYLALRLAKANCIRANRLEITRHNRRDQLPSKPVQVNGHDCSPSSVGSESSDSPDAERFFDRMGLNVPKDHIPALMEDQKAQEKRIRERLEQQCQALRSHTEEDPLTDEQGRDVLHRHQQKLQSSQGSIVRSAAEDDRHTRLAKMHLLPLSTRPTSVLNVRGGERDDPDYFPVIFPGGSRFVQSLKSCTICSKSDHQLEDCPYQKREGFWWVTGSRSRASSVHSQSSKRNSSLHGSGRLDLEDQDLSFPGDRLRRSSASFSESSAAFPPPPVYIERERYPPADGSKEIMDQAPKPLRFFCDICEQEVEFLRRRDWQTHVLQDIQPYVCTVEDCDEPMTQFNSRRAYILHEIRPHELKPEDFDSDLLERKLRESAAGVCVFCGEQTGGKDNNRQKHIGRHMEEIAFAVVRRPYEEWDFYSDSSDPAHHDTKSDTQANTWTRARLLREIEVEMSQMTQTNSRRSEPDGRVFPLPRRLLSTI